MFKTKKEETYVRTVAKSIVYRASHLLTFFLLAKFFGGSNLQGGTMVFVVLTFGTFLYFTYDRIWLLFKWDRFNGFDTQRRSVVKSIVYRFVIFIAATILAMLVLKVDLQTAMTFSITDQIISLILYYFWERVVQLIPWGKVIEKEEKVASATE